MYERSAGKTMNIQTLLYIEIGILFSVPVATILLAVILWRRFDDEGIGNIERFEKCTSYACMIMLVLYITVLPICLLIVLVKR